MLYEQDKLEEAILNCKKAVEAFYNLALVLNKKGKSRIRYQDIRDPKHANAYNNLAVIFYNKGKLEEAI